MAAAPHHEQHAVPGGGKEAGVRDPAGHGDHGRGLSEDAGEGRTVLRDLFGDYGSGHLLRGSKNFILFSGPCIPLSASEGICLRGGPGRDPFAEYRDLRGGDAAVRKGGSEGGNRGGDSGLRADGIQMVGYGRELNASTWTIRNYPETKEKWYDLLIEAGADVKTRMIRDELGEMASIYETVARLKGMSPVQARMEIMKVDM